MILNAVPCSGAKAEKVPDSVYYACKQSVPRVISGTTIAKTNFLELAVALLVRVGSTKDFKPYADGAR